MDFNVYFSILLKSITKQSNKHNFTSFVTYFATFVKSLIFNKNKNYYKVKMQIKLDLV